MKCEVCNVEFETASTKANHVRWQHKRQQSQIKCEFCGIAFEAPNAQQHIAKCTQAIEFTWCATCKKSTPNNLYCSKSCAATSNNKQGTIGYGMYRKNNDIVKKKTYRDVCLEVWSPCCAICGWDISFDIHHVNDVHTDDRPENLIPLCQNHHTMTRMIEHKEMIRRQIESKVQERFGVVA